MLGPSSNLASGLRSLVLISAFSGASIDAHALECGEPTRTFQQNYEHAAFVFVGVIYRLEAPVDANWAAPNPGQNNPTVVIDEEHEPKVFERTFGPYTASFAVLDLLKGDKESIPSIQFSGFAGDLHPEIGMGYLIFADRSGHTGSCWGSEESTSYMTKNSKERTAVRAEVARIRALDADAPVREAQ